MRNSVLAAIIAVLAMLAVSIAQNVPIYTNQGASELTIGTGGSLVIGPGVAKFTPTDTEPTSPAEGWVYWDDSENSLKWYSGAAWAALATAGGGTLDQAYDYGGAGSGKAVTVDSGAVALSSTAADNNGILTLSKVPVGAQSGAGLSVTMGANCSGAGIAFVNTGTGNDLLGSGSTWSVSKAGVASFAATTVTTLTASSAIYQAAIAAAAAGNQALTIDAAGNGTITVGGTSTGNTIFPGVVQFNGNTTLGNALTDTVTVTGSIAANVTIDDGVTDSPSLIFQDATDETVTIAKIDAGHLAITTVAGDGIKVLTGNLWVGNGAPGTAAMNGEDFYVEGAAEFDSTVQFDGAVTLASTITASAAEIQGATPLVFEALTDDGFEISLAVADVGADYTVTLPAGTGAVMLSSLTTNAPDAANAVTGGSNQLIFEGATGGADAFETVITPTDPTADQTVTLPNASGTLMLSSLATNGADILNSVTGASNALVFEGAANDFEISLTAADATADASITLPNAAGTVVLSSLATNAPDAANAVTGASNALVFEGATANDFEISLAPADATADRTITLPDRAGTVTIETRAVTAQIAPYNVLTSDAGQVMTNTGDGDGTTLTLPEASTAIGMSFTFVVLAAQNFYVDCDAADTIKGLTNANGDRILNSTAGSTVTVMAADATNWVVLGSYGTWTDAD